MANVSKGTRGTAVIEVALMAPWLLFLFIGIVDFGVYAYSAICTQNAARVAASFVAKDPATVTNAAACQAALPEFSLFNAYLLTSCGVSPGDVSDSSPVAVSATTLTNETSPPCADCVVEPTATSALVTVTYRTVPMIPIPGILMGQMQLTRTAEMRIMQ